MLSLYENNKLTSGIIEAVTGSGKTMLGLSIINDNSTKKILVITPTIVFAKQWFDEIIKYKLSTSNNLGIYYSRYKKIGDITVAVINSIRNINLVFLEQFDIVIGAIHSGFKNPKEKTTKRMIRAMQNENVDIIAHPTGRLITKREAYEIDLEKVFDEAKKTGTVMEINSYPERMDLKDTDVRAAIKNGVKLVISTDSHNTDQLKFIKLGIGTARRGWARKEDIINTRSLKEMMKMLK